MPGRTLVIFWGSTVAAVLLLSTAVTAWPYRSNPADGAVLGVAVAGLTASLAVATRIIWVTQRRHR
jgi:hypothetical protein